MTMLPVRSNVETTFISARIRALVDKTVRLVVKDVYPRSVSAKILRQVTIIWSVRKG